jgi:hypothetical protein
MPIISSPLQFIFSPLQYGRADGARLSASFGNNVLRV